MARITRAAVKIFDKKQEKEIIIPCHRHCDAFRILKEFGYYRRDYDILDQGFLDRDDVFLTRIEARREAELHGQLLPSAINSAGNDMRLYSEDLW